MFTPFYLLFGLVMAVTLHGTRSDHVIKTRIESVRINGTSYVAVVGMKLPFVKAEEYCANEFRTSMHLASIDSDREWKLMRENFGALLGEEIWLGGIVSKNAQDEVELNWLDRSSVHYHNLTREQLSYLSKEIVEDNPKPLIGSLLTGMWSVELLDQQDDLMNAFICKIGKSSKFEGMVHRPPMFHLRKFFFDMMNPFWRHNGPFFDTYFNRHSRHFGKNPTTSQESAKVNFGSLNGPESAKKRDDSVAINLGALTANKQNEDNITPNIIIKNIVPKDI
ncbi:hypothetical protein Ciccas_011540 [Cichlidogyrus casuarinus]|uniref:C-type lectin domain-containing protein n=1 Tax=Cichlidogyrus casuarinus TaxID=1844966 RepID=A0ABD2PRD1_9PLAT